jgi:hypothetical protein
VFGARSVGCNLRTGSPATVHASAIDAGPQVVVSCASTFSTMFLQVVKSCRVWLYALLPLFQIWPVLPRNTGYFDLMMCGGGHPAYIL